MNQEAGGGDHSSRNLWIRRSEAATRVGGGMEQDLGYQVVIKTAPNISVSGQVLSYITGRLERIVKEASTLTTPASVIGF